MYQFKKKSDDEYILECNGKEYPFTRTIDIAREMQSVDLETTFIVSEFLAERGETYENTKLVITRQVGNKTIVDESNLKRLEQSAHNQAYFEVLDSIFKKTIKLSYINTMQEIGAKTEEDVNKFISEFANLIVHGIDDTPRSENT